MSRLIDADARVTVRSFDRMNDEYSHDEMSISEALDFATDEGCPPTINAIPVEWLRGLMIIYANIKTPEYASYAYCLNNVIEGWQKEQEAHST